MGLRPARPGEQEGAKPVTKKTFKDYEPGFVHIDIKYLPQMPDETSRRYLFVAIDRATRWVYIELYAEIILLIMGLDSKTPHTCLWLSPTG